MIPTKLYNHTIKNILDGSFSYQNDYFINLYINSQFHKNATNQTQAEKDSEIFPDANGFLKDDKTFKFSIKTFNQSAAWIPDSITWRVTDATIFADSAIIFHKSSGKPFAFLEFGQTRTASKGSNFTFQIDDLGLIFFNLPD